MLLGDRLNQVNALQDQVVEPAPRLGEYDRTRAFYRDLPKVDLHRHLEGSLRLSTIIEIARAKKFDLPHADRNKIQKLVQIQNGEPHTSANFLTKFATLRLYYRSPEIIRRITREAIEDAARDNIRYLELRFTPVALSKAEGYTKGEVMDWVIESAAEAAQDFNLPTRLIASVNRHECLSLAEEVVQAAVDRIDRGIVGLDLAGDEANYPGLEFAPLFREAQEAGLHLTIHAGEWGGAANVLDAIEKFGASRIGHGVRVMEDPDVIEIARERRITFEVCPTSNVQTGVTTAHRSHPLKEMIRQGLHVTINSDDPGISNIVLSDEFEIAGETLNISAEDLHRSNVQALKCAFLDKDISKIFTADLEQEYEKLISAT